MRRGRPFTGAWIETSSFSRSARCMAVAPSRGRGSKHRPDRGRRDDSKVAPSRGRGSKHNSRGRATLAGRRPFTGAWIETTVDRPAPRGAMSRPFTGAWIETPARATWSMCRASRPFTGAWIETTEELNAFSREQVAPSRGRGSKQPSLRASRGPRPVAPSRGRGSKHGPQAGQVMRGRSPLHGGVDRNPRWRHRGLRHERSPLHGGVDRNGLAVAGQCGRGLSPLHGGVDRNAKASQPSRKTASRPFTGAWIETLKPSLNLR